MSEAVTGAAQLQKEQPIPARALLWAQAAGRPARAAFPTRHCGRKALYECACVHVWRTPAYCLFPTYFPIFDRVVNRILGGSVIF